MAGSADIPMMIQADSRQLPIASSTVQCVVTSPPYWGLRDYGIEGQIGLEKTPEEYVTNMVAVFREVWRVLKADGTLWLNIGDSYNGYMANQRATSISANNQEARPVFESGRGKRTEGLKAKDLVGIPWRVAFALQSDGWVLRSDIIWSKPNPMPESVTDRPTKAHEYLFLLAKSERYYYDCDAIAETQTQSSRERARYGWAGRTDDNSNGARTGSSFKRMAESGEPIATIPADGMRNKRSVWHIATQPYSGAHFATFPEKLVEPCILAGSRPGDVVLDPFVGSGTVIRVATRHQRRGVGCDLNPDYLHRQAKKRTVKIQVEMHFAGGSTEQSAAIPDRG